MRQRRRRGHSKGTYAPILLQLLPKAATYRNFWYVLTRTNCLLGRCSRMRALAEGFDTFTSADELALAAPSDADQLGTITVTLSSVPCTDFTVTVTVGVTC